MKKFGKVLAMALALLTVVSLLPVTALADGMALFRYSDESEETIVDMPEIFEVESVDDVIVDIEDEFEEEEEGTVSVQALDEVAAPEAEGDTGSETPAAPTTADIYVLVERPTTSTTNPSEYVIASTNMGVAKLFAADYNEGVYSITEQDIIIYQGGEFCGNKPYIIAKDVEAGSNWSIRNSTSSSYARHIQTTAFETNPYLTYDSSKKTFGFTETLVDKVFVHNVSANYVNTLTFDSATGNCLYYDTENGKWAIYNTTTIKNVYFFEKRTVNLSDIPVMTQGEYISNNSIDYCLLFKVGGRSGVSRYSLYKEDGDSVTFDIDDSNSVASLPGAGKIKFEYVTDYFEDKEGYVPNSEFDPETNTVTFNRDGAGMVKATCEYGLMTFVSTLALEKKSVEYEAQIRRNGADAGSYFSVKVPTNTLSVRIKRNGEIISDYNPNDISWSVVEDEDKIVAGLENENSATVTYSFKDKNYGRILLRVEYKIGEGNVCYDTVRIEYKDPTTFNGIEVDKTVYKEDDNTYKLELEAYATGTSYTTNVAKPVATTLVLDISMSMCCSVEGAEEIPVTEEVIEKATKYPYYYTNYIAKDGNSSLAIRYNCYNLNNWFIYKEGNWAGPITNPEFVYQTRFGALIDAIEKYVEQMIESAKTLKDGEYHTLSIVLFSDGETSYENKEIFKDLHIDKNTTVESVMDVISDEMRKDNGPHLTGSTNTSRGFKHALKIMEAPDSSYQEKDRGKTVVLFTDGVPTRGSYFSDVEATTALNEALKIKEFGAKIFTVGFLGRMEGIGSESNIVPVYDPNYAIPTPFDASPRSAPSCFVNSFLNLVSSNYPSAKAKKIDDGKGWSTSNIENIDLDSRNKDGVDYYLAATNAEELSEMFELVAHTTSKVTTEVGFDSELRDVISDNFALPDDIEQYPEKYIIPEVYAITPDGDWVFDPVTTKTLEYKVDFKTKTVTVTNFDYTSDENCVITHYKKNEETGEIESDFYFTGKKIVLTIKGIKSLSTISGVVQTNDATSGVYIDVNGKWEFVDFPVPETDVKYFLVYHSSAKGDEERFIQKLSDGVLDENGYVDLTKYVYDLRETGDDSEEPHFIYGGLYSDKNFTTPLNSEGITEKYGDGNIHGKQLKPILADNDDDCSKYYIKEVDDRYLRPKTTTTIYYALFYTNMITAVDTLNYQLVGFDFTDAKQVNGGEETLIDKETVKVWNDDAKDERVYNSLIYNMRNGNVFEYFLRDSDIAENKDEAKIQHALFPNLDKVKKQVDVEGFLIAHEHDSFNDLLFRYGDNFDISFNAKPYYITMDDIKVYGVIDRNLLYKNAVRLNMNDDTVDNPTVDDKYVASVTELVPKENPVATAIPLSSGLKYSGSKNVVPKAYPVITKNYADGSESQAVLKGNNEGLVWHKPSAGQLFAGWFADKACKAPADFSNIKSNLMVFAKYVSDDYLDLNVIPNKTRNAITSITLVSAIDGKNYSSKGFEITIGGKTTKYEVEQFLSVVNNSKPDGMFGGDVSDKSKMFSYTLETLSLKDGTKITVSPYWITGDGTLVYGSTKSFTYYTNAIIG